MNDFLTQIHCEEVYEGDDEELWMEVRIADLKQDIKDAKHDLYCTEMSDDFCYSNGRYDAKEKIIRNLEAKLAILED